MPLDTLLAPYTFRNRVFCRGWMRAGRRNYLSLRRRSH